VAINPTASTIAMICENRNRFFMVFYLLV